MFASGATSCTIPYSRQDLRKPGTVSSLLSMLATYLFGGGPLVWGPPLGPQTVHNGCRSRPSYRNLTHPSRNITFIVRLREAYNWTPFWRWRWQCMKGDTSLGVAAAYTYETSYALAWHPFAWVSDSPTLARTVLRGSPEGAPGESKPLLTMVWNTFGPGSTACTTAPLVSECCSVKEFECTPSS